MGIEITITQSSIAKLIGFDNTGLFEIDKNSIPLDFREEIKSTLYWNLEESDKVVNMCDLDIIYFKFIILYIIPREGSTDQPNWIHKVMLLHLHKKVKLNLAWYVFNHLCTTIDKTHK